MTTGVELELESNLEGHTHADSLDFVKSLGLRVFYAARQSTVSKTC